MKDISIFLLVFLIAFPILSHEHNASELAKEQVPINQRIPEVYDTRVWSDDHLTTTGRWYNLLFITDTLEIQHNFGNENTSVSKLINAVAHYHASRYDECIRICRDILSHEKDKLILLEAHFILGTSIIKSDETDDDHFTAKPHFESALQLALSASKPMYEKAGKITCNMGHCIAINTRFHDAAIACWRRSVDYFSKADLQFPHPYYNMATHTLSREMVPNYLDSALAIIDLEKKDKPSPERAVCLSFYGQHYWFNGPLVKSFELFNEAVEEYIAYYGEDHPSLIGAYLDIAWFCYYPNAPDLAMLYSRKALDLALRHLDISDDQIGNIYNVIGLCHMILGNYEQAIGNFKKRFSQNYKGEWSYFLMATRTWNNIALCHIKKGNYDEAILLVKKAIALENEFKTPEKIDRYNTDPNQASIWYINLGQGYQQKSAFKKALDSYLLILNSFKKIGGSCNTTVAGIYCEMALCYEKSGQPSKAKEFYSNALESLYCEIVNRALLADFMRDWTILFALTGKAKIYHHHWKLAGNQSDLDSANHIFKLAIDQIEVMQQNFRKSGSRFRITHILSEVQAVYEGAIACHLEKYKLTKQKRYLEEAFALAEKSKAILLLESVRETGQGQFADVPDTLVRQWNGLKQTISGLKTDIWREEQHASQAEKNQIKTLQSSLFDHWREYEKLTRELREKYPASIKGIDMEVISLRDIQHSLLNPGQALIAYFEGYSSIFAFVITGDSAYVEEIPVDFPLEQYVQDLRSGIYNDFVGQQLQGNQNMPERNTGYEPSAHALYTKLIKPLGILPEELIIVPDGMLGYIPFEVLLVNSPEESEINEPEYLINRHLVSYNYSATMWREMTQRNVEKEGLLAFAPTFTDKSADYVSISDYRGEDLGPLLYNDDEVSYIRSLITGKALYGEEATADNFKSLAADYGILHLSTHAKLNDENADYSFLAFTGEKGDEAGRLYISDLSQMNLSAEMVVLSACETGIGKLQRGEGILSFARAFSSAGARSIVTSLWKANDKTTYEIMKSFYRKLKEGKTKAQALRLAKLDYLASHKGEELHPFYWATFIPVGDMSPIEIEAGSSVLLWRWIPLVVLVAGIGWFVIMHKTKKAGPASQPHVVMEKLADSKSTLP